MDADAHLLLLTLHRVRPVVSLPPSILLALRLAENGVSTAFSMVQPI
jgi:hypothetical protein